MNTTQLNESIEDDNQDVQEVRFVESAMVGKFYDKIILILFFMSLLEVYTYASSSVYQDTVKYFVHHLAILYELSVGVCYTAHFMYLV
jgi:hypothetical protein